MSKRRRRKQEKRRRHEGNAPGKRRLAAGAGLTIGATLAAAGSAQAADFQVNLLGDAGNGVCNDGSCTLRDAVLESNNAPGPDRILFQSGLSGTIELANNQLSIYDQVEVLGPSPGTLTVRAANNARVAYVYSPSDEPVLISGLTLTGGDTTIGGAIFSGGVIDPDETPLTIANSVLTGNHSSSLGGGAIWVGAGSIHIESSTISGNVADNAGGGIYFRNSLDTAQSTIRNSTISGNTVTDAGGTFDDGGAIYLTNGFNQGPLLVENSTLTGNSAPSNGGAIYDRTNDQVVTVSNSTISNNSADDDGGGIFTKYGQTLQNTIVANNVAGNQGPDLFSDDTSAIFDTAFSLIENPAGANINSTGPNIFGADPQLGPLQNNGGPTQTLALAPTSPALDKGSSGLGADQRGSVRPFDFGANLNAPGGNGADIGAFELAPTSCQGRAVTIVARAGQTTTGTAGPDVIVGTDARDVIRSGKGADRVCARSGNDKVAGQSGKDRVNGDQGKDNLSGGKGKDNLKGAKGKDTLKGGKGSDTLKGGAGKDKLFGQAGKDKLVGGAKNDTCVGGPGKDTTKGC